MHPAARGAFRSSGARGNPVGPGATWINAWFVEKDVDREVYPDYCGDDFVAIHSTYRDNVHLDQAAYAKRLQNAPAHIRKAWLEGEFIPSETAYFADFELWRLDDAGTKVEWHCTTRFPDLARCLIYRAVDWGFSPAPAVCLWIAVEPSGAATVFKELAWTRTTAADVAREIRAASDGMKVVETFCDPTMFANSEATGNSLGDIFQRNGIPLTPSKNDRAAAGSAIHEWLGTVVNGSPSPIAPPSPTAERPKLSSLRARLSDAGENVPGSAGRLEEPGPHR